MLLILREACRSVSWVSVVTTGRNVCRTWLLYELCASSVLVVNSFRINQLHPVQGLCQDHLSQTLIRNGLLIISVGGLPVFRCTLHLLFDICCELLNGFFQVSDLSDKIVFPMVRVGGIP